MCGILVYTKDTALLPNLDPIRTLVKKRGPSYYGKSNTGRYILESSVLSLRSPPQAQPFIGGTNGTFHLAYNGEIYNIEGNDTKFFFEKASKSPREAIRLEGEYAFACSDGVELYFGRDPIGRRSLLFMQVTNGILVTSVSDGSLPLQECVAGSLYTFDGTRLTEEPRDPFPLINSVSRYCNVSIEQTLDQLLLVLKGSVLRRCVRKSSVTKIGILFSGGLDCSIIVRLLDLVLEDDMELELFNVAFESQRTGLLYDTPDRLLGLRSFEELKSHCGRRLKFTGINVSYAEATAAYQRVQALMHPAKTVMDQSIALAFHFASSGGNSSDASPILFSGLGADELFAGYRRHVKAAARGPDALIEELSLDFERLGSRNLGRDDRVCAHWGKEVRYPYLDSEVVDFAFKLEPMLKCRGDKTKLILRLLAEKLGLSHVALESKRAIQFGARTAKMDKDSGRTRGQDMITPYPELSTFAPSYELK